MIPDPADDGIHIVWLTKHAVIDISINDVAAESKDWLGRVGPNLQEWRSLYFDALKADPGFLANKEKSTAFVGEIDGFPMLSRINGDYFDAVFAPGEAEQLHDECQRLSQSVTSHALTAIEKIDSVAKLATERRSGIFFEGE